MRNPILFLTLLLTLCAASGQAEARLYDPATDGPCWDLKTAQFAWPDAVSYRWRPMRANNRGKHCWYAPDALGKLGPEALTSNRFYSASLDGACLSRRDASKLTAGSHRPKLAFRPMRDGTRCWFAPGDPRTQRPVAEQRPIHSSQRPARAAGHKQKPAPAWNARRTQQRNEAATQMAIEHLMGPQTYPVWREFDARFKGVPSRGR